MTEAEEFERWKRQVQDLRRRADRAQGALDGLRRRLQEEFNCASVEEGEKLARRLRREAGRKQEEFDRARTTFEEQWGGRFEGREL